MTNAPIGGWAGNPKDQATWERLNQPDPPGTKSWCPICMETVIEPHDVEACIEAHPLDDD